MSADRLGRKLRVDKILCFNCVAGAQTSEFNFSDSDDGNLVSHPDFNEKPALAMNERSGLRLWSTGPHRTRLAGGEAAARFMLCFHRSGRNGTGFLFKPLPSLWCTLPCKVLFPQHLLLPSKHLCLCRLQKPITCVWGTGSWHTLIYRHCFHYTVSWMLGHQSQSGQHWFDWFRMTSLHTV